MKETTQPPKDPKKKLWIGYAVILAIVILSNVFLFPFQSHVIPDHVFGLIQIAVLQIFYFQSHRWQMVPVHHKYHRLRIIRKLCRQLFDKYVHLMNLIYIIFK